MQWTAIAILVLVGVALVAARKPLAEFQAATLGARTGPGCVLAEGVFILLVALAIFLARGRL
jgi:hypothetical protein